MHPLVDFSRAFPDQVMSVVSRYLLSGDNTAVNYYVATTGSDSNDGLSASTPFLTVQKAINTIGAGLFSGKVFINVADGTYNGNIVAKPCLGKNTTSQTSTVLPALSPTIVEILGNTSTPDNVILIGDNTLVATFVMENVNTLYIVNGVDIRSNSAAASRAFYTAGNQSSLIIRNCNASAIGLFIFANFGSRITFASDANGGTIACTAAFITVGYQAYVRIDRGVSVTGMTSGSGVTVSRQGTVYFNTTGQTYNFTTTSPTAIAMFQPAGYNALILGFGSGDVINITSRTVQVIRPINGGKVSFTGGATFNLTDCTAGVAWLDSECTYHEVIASTWNYLGTSVATYRIHDAAVNLCLNNFTSAVPTFLSNDTDFKFGYDWRYTTPVRAINAGVIPPALLGGNSYMGPAANQATIIYLYKANQDESIDKLEVDSGVGNGAAHTDTYTVYKNGVATTMVVSITNGTTGSTTTNPVTLAAGDLVSIVLNSAALSTAADITAQMTIRKT